MAEIDKAKAALEGYGTISDRDIDHALGRESFSDRFGFGPSDRDIHDAFDIDFADKVALDALDNNFDGKLFGQDLGFDKFGVSFSSVESGGKGISFGKIALGAWFMFESVNSFLAGIGLAITVGLTVNPLAGLAIFGLASPAFFMLGKIQYQHGREFLAEGLGYKK